MINDYILNDLEILLDKEEAGFKGGYGKELIERFISDKRRELDEAHDDFSERVKDVSLMDEGLSIDDDYLY